MKPVIRNLTALLIPAAMAAQSVVGDWHTGKTDAALEIHISKSGRGYAGELRNMDHPEVALPLAGIVAQKSALRFEVPAVKAAVGPHLHFQVTDSPSPFGSEGLPYVFDRFSRDGVAHMNEIPLRDWVIHFP